MDRSTALRAGLVQTAAVAVLSVVLAVALGHDFFESWGWLAGPLAWIGCALVTALALALPVPPALTGAVLAGLPSLLAVAAGVHWLGAALAIVLFALWCGRLRVDRGLQAEVL